MFTRLVFACLYIACLLAATDSTTGHPEFACKSNLPYDFRNIHRFTDNMCAQCLWYMAADQAPWRDFHFVINWKVMYNYSDTVNVRLCTPNCTEFKYKHLFDSNNDIVRQFKSQYYLDLILNCCEQARQCCEEMLRMDQPGEDYCPAKWDGYMCWNAAKAGTINYQTCPSMTYFALNIKPTSCRNEISSKECKSNSTWARIWKDGCNSSSAECSEEYTNYLPCSTPGATRKLNLIHLSIGTYLISLVLTIVGVTLLHVFPLRKLPLLGIVHRNFLYSLVITSLFSLSVLIFIKRQHYKLNSMIDKNPLWCRMLMIAMKTARLTNYGWMLIEGIILWQMIYIPFRVGHGIKMYRYHAIGWGLPILIMAAYSAVHSTGQFNRSCWTKPMGNWEWIYTILPLIVIVVNFILFISMYYVLLIKINSLDDSQHLESAVKKAFILVPIFGIQYFFYFVPFDPFESCSAFLFICHYLLNIIEALQGAIVTTIFCFFNKEVRNNICQYLAKRGRERANEREMVPLKRNSRSRSLH